MDDPQETAYQDLLTDLDAWFRRTSAEHPGTVPCRAGCSACCHGPFDISVADALLVREGVARLTPAERQDSLDRAMILEQMMRSLDPRWNGDVAAVGEAGFDRLSERLALEPCPLLDDAGHCRIYDHRPMVCRLIGLGIRTPAGRVIDNACPIQDEFPAYAALPPQLLDLETLETVEATCLETASTILFGTPARAGFETTVAGALNKVRSKK
ncbi:MAG: YkgJ family cysteine cluster protein [Gemmatimonadales bacterium]